MDKVHGIFFIYNVFGTNANQRHKNFKALLACQNHLIKPPPITNFPYWRLQPLIMLLKFIIPPILMLGVAFYIDEMTIRFKGFHAYKKIMKYKAKGGGLQIYSIFQKGYTYQIFMLNDPLPKIYLAKRMLSLHAILLSLFVLVPDKTLHKGTTPILFGTRGSLIMDSDISPYSIYQLIYSFSLFNYTDEPVDGDKIGAVATTPNNLLSSPIN